ncbi:hypothetical protein [Streptomyces millisiae]|uniref:Peptidoglycan binding domain-containing protein n=1 Tax=Streptomyces millisiae TaxID=3075542 RepID=A0ABU2LW71_9ACTN|nr:hypothetical protein [Streptomyces sp. DSM 44918]MDT0321826.1 hypothetical protein [Streptomyces sp. DSM 44918]
MVREPVNEAAMRAATATPSAAPAASEPPAAPGAVGGGKTSAKKTSSWFEPRKAPPNRPGSTDHTPSGGHPVVTETPPDGMPGLGAPAGGGWAGVPQRTDTPAAGIPQLPPRPVGTGPAGPTAGPMAGTMPLPAREPVPVGGPLPPALGDQEPDGSTMDLGGPFPPPPPSDVLAATGPMPRITDTGPLPQVPSAGSPRPPAPAPEPADEPEPPAPKPAAPARRKGRSKMRLLVVAVVGIAVVAYGVGLFMSPKDVPAGTTVLGVDIGGLSSQEAQARLDSQLEAANETPLTLLVGDREIELKPSVAGLAVDTEGTVRAVSGQDYSPVAVFGSLVGAERAENAVFAVDREKLTVALDGIATESGGAGPVEGTVVFENGEAIGRAGEPGNAIDVQAAADAVEAAFRERAATGRNPVVELPVSAQEPAVGEEQIQQALTEFGEPAMSGWVWLMAGGREIPMSPTTIDDFLSMQAGESGALQPVIDMEVLAATYGSTFDGVMIDAGAGPVPMTPEHAAAALIPALRETATVDEGPGRREAVVEGAVSP